MDACRICTVALGEANWFPSLQRKGNRICKACNNEKGKAFNRAQTVKHGRSPNTALMRKVGITVNDVHDMERRQCGRCAICNSDAPTGAYTKLHIDHDHATNTARDLLCIKCNQGLGLFMDNPEFLEAAAAYIRWHKRKPKAA